MTHATARGTLRLVPPPKMTARVESTQEDDESVTKLSIESLITDPTLQPRVKIAPHIVRKYARALDRGDNLPPVTVFFDGETYRLADGFHRLAAHKEAARAIVHADVRAGTHRDALLFSAGANFGEFFHRGHADKQRAIEVLLRDPEWSAWADAKIARHCRVAASNVARTRARVGLPPASARRSGARAARSTDASASGSARSVSTARPAARSSSIGLARPIPTTTTHAPAAASKARITCAIVDAAGVLDGSGVADITRSLDELRHAITGGALASDAHVYVFTGPDWCDVVESLRDLLEVQEWPIVWTRSQSVASGAQWFENQSTLVMFGRVRGSTRKSLWPASTVFGHPVTVLNGFIDRSTGPSERAADPTGRSMLVRRVAETRALVSQ